MGNGIDTATGLETVRNGSDPGTKTRIAAYLLTDYLEKLGVEVIFGL